MHRRRSNFDLDFLIIYLVGLGSCFLLVFNLDGEPVGVPEGTPFGALTLD